MDYVTRQFVNLAKKLRDDVRKALSTIHGDLQKQAAAVSQAAKATQENKQQPLPIPLPVKAEFQVPEAVQAEQRAQYSRSHRVQVLLMVGTWLAFIAAAVYAGIAAFQWRTMNKTYAEIQKQTAAVQDTAKAAQDQATLMSQQLKGTMAAVLSFNVNLYQIGTLNRLELSIGRAPGGVIAHNVSTKLIVKILTLPGKQQIGDTSQFSEGPEDLKPADASEIAQGGGQIVRRFPIPGFTQELWESMRHLEKTMRVEGRFSYENGFGDTITRSECKSILASGFAVVEPPSGLTIVPARTDFVDCDSFNGLMQEAFQSKREAERLEQLRKQERNKH